MGKLLVFNLVTVDGYFTDEKSDMSFAYTQTPDAEWDEFVSGNARGGGILLFGRVTYELMASFWPTPLAADSMPAVAERMNALPKVVFSRTLDRAQWNNTRLVKDDLIGEVRRMKKESAEDMAILGSGNIVAQLAPHGLIDEYQIAVVPIALGKGRTMFQGITAKVPLKLTRTRIFRNGRVLLCYTPLA
jgi:dihydrofolate reductase